MKMIVKKNQVFNFGKTFDVQKCFACQEACKYGDSCFNCKNYASEMVQVDGTVEEFVKKNISMFKSDGMVRINNVDDVLTLMYALCDEFALPFQSYNLFWDATDDSILIQRLYRRDDLWITLASIQLYGEYAVISYRTQNSSNKKAVKIAEKISKLLSESAKFV